MMNERLYRVLRLTESPNDHEALSALRIAQGIMREKKISWENTLGGRQDDFSSINQQVRLKTAELSIINMKITDAERKLAELNRKIIVQESARVREPWERPSLTQMANFLSLLATRVEEDGNYSTKNFFNSLRMQWETKRRLSDKQFACLLRMYSELTGMEFKF